MAISRVEDEIAGLRAFYFAGDMAVDFWAAANETGRKNYTSFVLLDALFQKAHEIGIKKYDMSGIEPVHNRGVYNFKKGVRGDIIEKCGEWEMTSHPAIGFLLERFVL